LLLRQPVRMADASSQPVFIPKINPEDHSAKVVVCGTLILPPVAMMASLSI
jgi:hypothetical protein